MKKLIFALSLILSLNSFAEDETRLSKKMCDEIAIDSSLVPFSINANSMLFPAYELDQDLGAAYIDNTKKALYEKFNNYCKDEPTLEGLKKVVFHSCNTQCAQEAKILKDSLFNKSAKNNAQIICHNICSKINSKFDAISLGATLGEKAKDCTGMVESTSRSNVKEWTPMKGKLPLYPAAVQPR